MFVKKLTKITVAGAIAISALAGSASAAELTLSYFMGPKHPMNKAVFTPFAEKLAEVSGGKLTVKQFAGGALNSSPPKQYSILLKGVADVAFALPGYTAQLFPITNVVTVPGVANSAIDGTEKLWNAVDIIEKEYKAKVLAMWTNRPPILLTKNKPIRSLEDMKGLKVRVTSAQNVPFIEALGASAVSQPVSVINQNLQNGTIDAILIDSSAIRSFKLYEPAKYLTVGIPGSGSPFVLLMNNRVFNSMSDQEKKWVDEASGRWLSESGGVGYDKAGDAGMQVSKDNNVELIELSAAEKAKFEKAMAPALEKFYQSKVAGELTGAKIVEAMKGQ